MRDMNKSCGLTPVICTFERDDQQMGPNERAGCVVADRISSPMGL